jgi:hypothetical protein
MTGSTTNINTIITIIIVIISSTATATELASMTTKRMVD